MKKYIYLSLAAVATLSSCNKLGQLSSDNFKVTPTPLVATAGQVPATISATFPEKYMKKKATVTCTPVLKCDGGELTSNSVTYQGEKIEGNGTAVNYKVGGTYSMKANYKYTDAIMQSDLYMRFDATLGKKIGKKVKKVSMPDVKIGYGVLATSELLGRCLSTVPAATAEDNFQRVIAQKQEANIKFLINQSNLRTSELSSVSLKDLIAVLKEINNDVEGRALDAIEVSAYASPDGKYNLNEKLAEKRQNTSADYLKKQLKAIKMDADINTKYTAEDWDGFQELVAASNIQDKQVILSVLSMYKDPEEREQQIRNMSAIFTDIKDGIMPELRRARLLVAYEVIGRSDEQIIDQFRDDASQLSVEELVYAANMLMETPESQEAWNKRITELYPQDFRAYNNLARLALQQGDVDAARKYLAQAAKIDSKAAEVNTNLGLIALMDGNVDAAETYLAKGSGADTYNDVLGCLNIAKGNYSQAAAYMTKSQTNAAALAQILSNDYASAKNTLAGIKSANATTNYLSAVLAARNGDAATLSNSLRTAVAQDPSLAARALKDLEFAKFTSTVKTICK